MKLLLKLKGLTTEYILVEDSRSNDDSWGNGFRRKRGKEWSSDSRYYQGRWTGKLKVSSPMFSPSPYNSDNHRNNILGITLTCLGKLFIETTDVPHAENIKESCKQWSDILSGHLGYDVSDLFNIFPWEHWTTSLKRKNTSISSVNEKIQGMTDDNLEMKLNNIFKNL